MLRHKAGLLNTDFKQPARQGRLPGRLPPAGAEHRPEDARRAGAGARHRGRGHRALLRPRRHLCGEERVPRGVDEDRQAGGAAGRGVAAPTTTPATARWPGHQIASAMQAQATRHAPAEAAAHGLRICERLRMQKLTPRATCCRSSSTRANAAAIRARVIEHKQPAPAAGRRALHLELRGPPDHPVPGAGDAARRAHLRAGRASRTNWRPTTR